MTVIMGEYVPQALHNVSLSRFSTMRVGGTAKTLWLPKTEGETLFIYHEILNGSCRFLGNGSNVLFAEGVHDLPLIYTGNLKEISFTEQGVYASAGVPLPLLYAYVKRFGCTGGEFLSGIPGTVGGGVIMNAGAFGKTIADLILSVRTASGEIFKKDCGFSYRSSRFMQENALVLGATFSFTKGDETESENRTRRYREIRESTQPLAQPSLGSVFRAVNGVPAWEWIHGAGLRGLSIGGAQVSPKHANFIVNTGGATATDVYRLIQTVKNRVFDAFGVKLIEEIQYIGEFYDSNS
ncbi:MAG: UDP-N-acetylmuramate dehydrogenase [Clostridia bacterium]|nr:UDP-N-acetylmuramate dehydrogenase [Clostridia bacterium]